MCVLRALDFSRYKDFGDLSKFCEYVRMRHNSRRFLEFIPPSVFELKGAVDFGHSSTRNLSKNTIKSTRSFARQDALNTRKENSTSYSSIYPSLPLFRIKLEKSFICTYRLSSITGRFGVATKALDFRKSRVTVGCPLSSHFRLSKSANLTGQSSVKFALLRT